MRVTIVPEAEAPPRPTLQRGGKRDQEAEAAVALLSFDQGVRIDLQESDQPTTVRLLLYAAAARLGRPIVVRAEGERRLVAVLDEGGDERR